MIPPRITAEGTSRACAAVESAAQTSKPTPNQNRHCAKVCPAM
jgi:hypothetical protein